MSRNEVQGVMDELRSLREARDALDDQIQRMEWGLGPCPSPATPQPDNPTSSPQEAVADAISVRQALPSQLAAVVEKQTNSRSSCHMGIEVTDSASGFVVIGGIGHYPGSNWSSVL